MLMLSIDASSNAATAALLKDGALLCEYTQNQSKTHSVKLLPMIERMLLDTGHSLPEVDVFACGIGPGSFTGLRIGVATARGFAKTLNAKAVPVNSLEALAENVSFFPGTVVSLVWARENEYFCAAYRNGEETISPCVMTTEELIAHMGKDAVILVGDWQEHDKDLLSRMPENVTGATGRACVMSAASIGQVATKKVLRGEAKDSESLVPLYLRKSQAEREYEEKHGESVQ